MNLFKKFYPHALAVLCFIVVSVIYFYPVLQGKQIFQSDIAQYTGMAKEQNDFRATNKTEPYWTNSAFGGMPTYQLGANYPHDYIKKLDHALRFLPRPADYLFLYFLGFYVLLLVIKIDPLKAFIGALAFGFSTYLIIILGVGHNAKAHAIAYMPIVIAGFILVFRKNYIIGGLLTMFATALEINANHFQMTYYLLLFLLLLCVYFTFCFIQKKEYKSILISFGILIVAGIFSIGANATNLLATSEYSKFSTRGKNELTLLPDGSKNTEKSSLSRDYITEYSYGIAESFNLIAPRLFGGSNNEALSQDSAMYQFMIAQGVPEEQAKDSISGIPTYWGKQPIVAAPAYIGIVVFFMAVVALWFDNRKIKYLFLSGILFSLLLSWGKNFSTLTNFFIDYIPLYDKFRAVSSIQVILEICLPVLAIMGLQTFFQIDKEKQLKSLWKSMAVVFGILLGLFLFKGIFNFSSNNDNYFLKNYGPNFLEALISDRKTLYSSDLLRSGFLTLLCSGILFFFIKNKLKQNTAIILVGFIMVLDLFFVAKKYVTSKDFVSSTEILMPFEETIADQNILKDTTHYRVFEINGNMSSARTSYFHKSIGGYHAAKPRRIQQIFDYQIAKNNFEVLNMLNVKYIIQNNEKGEETPIINPSTNGNAWFIETAEFVKDADSEMKALTSFDSKKVVLINEKENKENLQNIKNVLKEIDTSATISLNVYKPNYLKYSSFTKKKGIAVFSEIYYKNGWNAYIDNKKVDYFNADYVLRAMIIPEGKHTIEFKFEPQVIKTGGFISLISSIGMLFLVVGSAFYKYKK